MMIERISSETISAKSESLERMSILVFLIEPLKFGGIFQPVVLIQPAGGLHLSIRTQISFDEFLCKLLRQISLAQFYSVPIFIF
jgi:hypothetical protein